MAVITESFCDRFHKAMELRDIKPSELSERTGISLSTISQYMSGYSKPKTERTALIATALNVDPAWLMGFDVPMERNEFKDVPKNTHLSFDNIEDFKKAYDKSKYRGDKLISAIIDNAENLNNDGKKNLLDYSNVLLGNPSFSLETQVNAAHARTDIEIPEGVDTSDDDVFDNF